MDPYIWILLCKNFILIKISLVFNWMVEELIFTSFYFKMLSTRHIIFMSWWLTIRILINGYKMLLLHTATKSQIKGEKRIQVWLRQYKNKNKNSKFIWIWIKINLKFIFDENSLNSLLKWKTTHDIWFHSMKKFYFIWVFFMVSGHYVMLDPIVMLNSFFFFFTSSYHNDFVIDN